MLDPENDSEPLGSDEALVRLLIGRKCRSLDFIVSDPELGWFRHLMENKRARGDLGGFMFNARRHLRLVDSLIDDELIYMQASDEAALSALNLVMLVLVLAVSHVWGQHNWLLAAACVCTGLVMAGINLAAKRRYDAIEGARYEQMATFQERLDEFVRKEWDGTCWNGGNYEPENQSTSSLRRQLIPAGTGALPMKP